MSEPTKAAMRASTRLAYTLPALPDDPEMVKRGIRKWAEEIDKETKLPQLLSAVSRILQCDYECPEEGESLDECLSALHDAYNDTFNGPDNDAETPQ